MSSNASFPIARVQLPKISLSRLEHRALKRMVTRMLHHTVREFDQHSYANGGVVDGARWKAVGSRDDTRVYREREAGAMSAALAYKTDILPHGSTIAPLTPPGMLVTGIARGKVENAMHAITSTSQEELALMLSVMHHEDVVDCALLETIEAPTENDPFHFLGIKYFARKTGMKYRDSVYVEFTGYTETTRGERLGFHVIHSVELSEFPFLTARNSVRTLQSVRYLYRQQSEDVVEVFMQGNLDDAQFSLSTLMACAEAKRLTQMWRVQQARNRRQDHRKQQARRASTALECTMCRQKKKRFGGASLAACELCANVICTRCRSDKKVFEMNANQILGKFRRLAACKSCILEANRALSQPDEPRLLIVMSEHLELDHEGSRSRRRCGTSSVGSSASRSRSASSCLSASSEECSPAPRLRPRGANESVTSSASTVSSKSYRECPIVPVSPMGMRAHGHQLVYTLNDQQMELQQQRAINTIKVSTERAYRIQQVGCDREAQQQLTLREHHRIPLQPSETVQNRQQALAPRSHRDYALRRVASTGSAFSSSYRGEYSSSTQNDLFARMVELNRVAESTYNTTQQNGVYLSQQMRSRRKT